MRRAMMYLRPGNLYKEFVIEDNKADIGKTGRATASFSGDGSRTLKGALAEATPKQKVEWQQLQHPISHTIIQDGRPKAKAEDKLILGERIFLIQGIDDPGRIQGKARLSGRLLMRCWFTRQQSTSAILFLITALEMRWFRS